MVDSKTNSLIEKMDELWITFIRCRSILPFVPLELVGVKGILKAGFYSKYKINISLYSEDGLTSDDINGMHKSGHYMNCSFIVRLHALLDYYKIFSDKLDESIDGFEDVNILRRLRNKIVHSTGKYNSDNPDDKKLYERMEDHYDLKTPPNHPDEWRLPIDTVLEPMFEGCKKYCIEYLKSLDS